MNSTVERPTFGAALRDRYPFASLLRPMVGLVNTVLPLEQEATAPQFEIATAGLDNLTMTFPYIAGKGQKDVRDEPIGGGGGDLDPEVAWVRAVAEAAERYCNCVVDPREWIVASARDLGPDELRLFDALPRCSARELADPLCPIHLPDPGARIRWVRGYSLTEGRECHVPLVMTHLYPEPTQEERFWLPISTGVAAHTDLAQALVSAICESIERDTIAITWLARLPLPRILLDEPVPEALAPNYRALSQSMVRQYFFDGTNELGVPTVYSVQLSDGQPQLAQYVSCATAADPVLALSKTIREAAPVRSVLILPRTIPDKVEDFTTLHDGALYLGRPENRSKFDFLLRSAQLRRLDQLAPGLPGSPAQQLQELVRRLKLAGMTAIAVDLTTSEVRATGLRVVRVVIPELMPMTCFQRARYLAHPRLYSYPERAGYGVLTEADINPDPQPYA